MAWNTERTKRLLLDAATVEFSERGFAGARIDRIAASAGVNKERIYQYFGGKDELFAAVLTAQLTQVMEAISLEGHGIEAVIDYVGRVFDYQSEHPELARLTFWEGLERLDPVAEQFRAERSASKVKHLRQAVPGLRQRDAQELLLTIVSLCSAFQALPHVDRLFQGSAGRDVKRIRRRRAAILTTVEATLMAMLASGPVSRTRAGRAEPRELIAERTSA